jgi:hypothetical protein
LGRKLSQSAERDHDVTGVDSALAANLSNNSAPCLSSFRGYGSNIADATVERDSLGEPERMPVKSRHIGSFRTNQPLARTVMLSKGQPEP